MRMSFDLSLDCRCVGCGRSMPIPEPGTASRTLEALGDSSGGVFFIETRQKCQCGARRARLAPSLG